jgi:hypothetical protein
MSFDIKAAVNALELQASNDTSWIDTYKVPSDMPTPLAPARPVTVPTSATNPSTNNPLNIPSLDIGPDGEVTYVPNTSPSGADLGTSSSVQDIKSVGQKVFGIFVANYVAILVGLVLIAGAVFSFSQVKDTIIAAAKTAK